MAFIEGIALSQELRINVNLIESKMTEPGKSEKTEILGNANLDFKINRSVPRSLMYFQNTST